MPLLVSALFLLSFLHSTPEGANPADRPTAARDSIPESLVQLADLERDLRFLASDELRGRATGTPEIDIAARYVAERFRALGLEPPVNAPGYFQEVPLVVAAPAHSGLIVAGNDTLENLRDFLSMSHLTADLAAEAAFVGFGIIDPDQGVDDYAGVDVSGKIAVARIGGPDGYEGPTAGFLPAARQYKAEAAAARGALALVEILDGGSPMSWDRYSGYFSAPRVQPAPELPSIPFFVARDPRSALRKTAAAADTLLIHSSGQSWTPIPARNVAAVVEGSDPRLRDEYVLLTAHYDHLGVGEPVGAEEDSIYNGARDNAMGTVALIAAAEALSLRPAARSVLLLALTGEEIGLFGSRHYVEYPLVPLDRTRFVLNTDGAGYTDTTIVTVIGLERTGASEVIRLAASSFGLDVIDDPVPSQNLFNRSDNVPFAQKGIPAPTLSPGFRAFDAALMETYHSPDDEVGPDFDFEYFRRYCATFARAGRLIADSPVPPMWTEGDPYAGTAKELYGGK